MTKERSRGFGKWGGVRRGVRKASLRKGRWECVGTHNG